jgi:regulator of protease activity HflC (stomatin/prohibitin superfamily)
MEDGMDNSSEETDPFYLPPGDVAGLIAFAIVYVFVIVTSAVVISSMVKVVHHAEVMVIERFGRYYTTLSPGLNFIIPFVDVPRKINWRWEEVTADGRNLGVRSLVTDRIDLREHVIDFGKQNVITKDTVQIQIDALVYFQIQDPRLAVLNIQNLPDAIELLTQSTLRNIIAGLTLDDTFSSRERINDELIQAIVRDVERWGVTITRVEVQNIIPPGCARGRARTRRPRQPPQGQAPTAAAHGR